MPQPLVCSLPYALYKIRIIAIKVLLNDLKHIEMTNTSFNLSIEVPIEFTSVMIHIICKSFCQNILYSHVYNRQMIPQNTIDTIDRNTVCNCYFLKFVNTIPYHKELLAPFPLQWITCPISLLLRVTQDSLSPMTNCPAPSRYVASTVGIHQLVSGDVLLVHRNLFVEDMFMYLLMIHHVGSPCVKWGCMGVCFLCSHIYHYKLKWIVDFEYKFWHSFILKLHCPPIEWNHPTSMAVLPHIRWKSMSNLTHWGRDKMDAISQKTFSSAFSWMTMLDFRLKFHWSLFLRVLSTILYHWFR